MFTDYVFTISQYSVALLSVLILCRCLRSMLSERTDPEIWAYVRVGKDTLPVTHWENLIGRSRSADVRIFGEGIRRIHAVLRRSAKGIWFVHDVFGRGSVWVNGVPVTEKGLPLQNGDRINLGGSCIRFLSMSTKQLDKNEKKRAWAGTKVSPAVTLAELSLLQAFLLLQHLYSSSGDERTSIVLAFATLFVLEWALYEALRLFNRLGFEIELLALFLTTLGLSVSASSQPEDLYKQVILITAAVLLFVLSGWWLRGLRRTYALRIPAGLLALALLALNIFTSDSVNGAKSWLEFGGFSFQPSEFVKALYIYVGAATLDVLYRRQNLYSFLLYSACCVIALALIGDFGTALIFFLTFLVISFMRSGSLATVLLAVTGAGMAGFLAVSIKPYIARRFAAWGHVWEDVYDTGYQQTRALSAAASGGLIGKGAGGGWLKNITASDTDMVFAYVCEEEGLIVAVCMVLAVVLMAFFAVRCARSGRSAYYAIAACAASAMLLVQLALNAFGSVDLLPFTGVTFPFVSRGGSSLLSCWMLMAYLKSVDNRKGASFAVRPVESEEPVFPEEEENAKEGKA